MIGQQPASSTRWGYIVAREPQTGIWRQYLQHILNNVGGSIQSPSELMNGVWNSDRTVPPVAPLTPNSGRNYILTQVCGFLPAIAVLEATGMCQ
jgi:hypothetical protein